MTTKVESADDLPPRFPSRKRRIATAVLIGGSLYWILRHRLVGRCEVTGFDDIEGGRTAIILDPRLIQIGGSLNF